MKKYCFTCIVIVFLLLAAGYSRAQQGVNDTLVTGAVVYMGDTIEAKTLPFVSLFNRLTDAQRRARAEWTRLRNAI